MGLFLNRAKEKPKAITMKIMKKMNKRYNLDVY